MQQRKKIKKIFKRVNFLLLWAFILHVSVAEAASKRKNTDNDQPGYVTEALAEDKKNNKLPLGASSANNSTKKASGGTTPFNKVDDKIPTAKPQSKNKKTSYAKSSKAKQSQWLPEMGENPDSPEVKKKKLEKKQQEEELVNNLSSLNYNTYILPKELYERPKDDYNNDHLPKVYFQSDYLKMIIRAIDNNDYKNLRVILDNYQLINEPHHNGDTILIYAIQNHSINAARILLGKGAQVDALNNRNRTALHYAAALGDIESIRLLLSMGANINAVDDLNMTPIDYARMAQQYQAELLLSQYLNAN